MISGRGVFRMKFSFRGGSRGKDGGGMVDCDPSMVLEVLSNCLRLPGGSMGSSALSLNLPGKEKGQQRCAASGFSASSNLRRGEQNNKGAEGGREGTIPIFLVNSEF